MAIKSLKYKGVLLFFIVCLIAFAFPFQVYLSSTFPIIFPYIILILFFKFKKIQINEIRENRILMMDITLFLFFICLIIHPLFQFVFRLISINELLSIEITFLLPLLFYVYFLNTNSKLEINSFIFGIFISGLIIGIDFAFDSYFKLATGHIREYSYKAFEYSQMRAGSTEITNSRINPFFRSMGLLESHSISASWIAFSSFSALYFIEKKKKTIRLIITIISFSLLIISLNFTSILCFSLIYLIFYSKFLKSSINFLKTLFIISILVIFLSLIIFFILGPFFFDILSENVTGQFAFLFNNSERVSHSDILSRYPLKEFVLTHPFSLIFGAGFSSHGLSQGGDLGFLESIFIFGIPLYFLFFSGSLMLIRYSYLQICKHGESCKLSDLEQNNKELLFAISIFSFIFFSEIHYSIWVSKSIQPLLYFSLAIIFKNLKYRYSIKKMSILKKSII